MTTVIPGARTERQAAENAEAVGLPAPSEEDRARVREVYDRYFRDAIHHRW